jgi:hypothetical protein
MVDEGFDRDERLSLRHRAFWTLVGALPRGPVGY